MSKTKDASLSAKVATDAPLLGAVTATEGTRMSGNMVDLTEAEDAMLVQLRRYTAAQSDPELHAELIASQMIEMVMEMTKVGDTDARTDFLPEMTPQEQSALDTVCALWQRIAQRNRPTPTTEATPDTTDVPLMGAVSTAETVKPEAALDGLPQDEQKLLELFRGSKGVSKSKLLRIVELFRNADDDERLEAEQKAAAQGHCETLIAQLIGIARTNHEKDQELPGRVQDEMNNYLYPLFHQEAPVLRDPFQRAGRLTEETGSALDTFALLIFGITGEGVHDDAFALGAIFERLCYHPTLGEFLICAALAAWRLAQEEGHKEKWLKSWERNRMPGFTG